MLANSQVTKEYNSCSKYYHLIKERVEVKECFMPLMDFSCSDISFFYCSDTTYDFLYDDSKKMSPSISEQIRCLDLQATEIKKKDTEIWEVNLTLDFFFSNCTDFSRRTSGLKHTVESFGPRPRLQLD